jgi:hypothetical protein
MAASLRDIQEYEERARRQGAQAQAQAAAAAAAARGETFGANGEPAAPQGGTFACAPDSCFGWAWSRAGWLAGWLSLAGD